VDRESISNKGGLSSGIVAVEPSLVRAQLEKLFTSAHLRNSKRSQDLLRFVVEAVLDGRADRIKERTIGVEVFGRELEYDTNHDSVVRNAAIEVRKRLAQYYLEPDHEDELRISMPQGGYVPEFSVPPSPSPFVLAATSGEKAQSRRWVGFLLVGLAALLPVAAAVFWLLAPSPRRDLDRFWAPLLSDPAGVLICVGQPSRVYTFAGPRRDSLDSKMATVGAAETPVLREADTLTLGELAPVSKNFVYFGDSVCMTKVGGILQSGSRAWAVRTAGTTSYQDLRGKSVVLIGLNNNIWTQRFTSNLRYHFVRLPEQQRDVILDRQNLDTPPWNVPAERSPEVFDDYAIVSRVFDLSTEKALVSIAAITQSGTQSAGEFITNSDYVRDAFRDARSDWQRKNIQIVLKTRIVTGAAGPPQVVARYFW
jgi:hypothetical protein